jgi:predicted RNA-binding protein with PUA-like domain
VSRTGTVAHLRDGTPVGAWLLKANPAVWDVGAFLASGAAVDRWRLARSYRCDLMAPGHPVVLWVTSGDPGRRPGVWGVGEVIGVAEDDVGEPDDPLWRDRAAQRQVRPYVEVRLDVLSEPVGADEVRGVPVLAGMELFRAPRMGSPVALTPQEWDALGGLLPTEYPLRP